MKTSKHKPVKTESAARKRRAERRREMTAKAITPMTYEQFVRAKREGAAMLAASRAQERGAPQQNNGAGQPGSAKKVGE